MKFYCVVCKEEIPNQDRARYETRGNYCEDCIVKASKAMRAKIRKQAWWDNFYAQQKSLQDSEDSEE